MPLINNQIEKLQNGDSVLNYKDVANITSATFTLPDTFNKIEIKNNNKGTLTIDINSQSYTILPFKKYNYNGDCTQISISSTINSNAFEIIATKDIPEVIDLAGSVAESLNSFSSQLAEKAQITDVNNSLTLKRDKAVKIELEDLSANTLGAMSGNATFNVLSVPQDTSVTNKKVDSLTLDNKFKYDVVPINNADLLTYITASYTGNKTLSIVSDANLGTCAKFDANGETGGGVITISIPLSDQIKKKLLKVGDTVKLSFMSYRTGNAAVLGGFLKVYHDTITETTVNYPNYTSPTKMDLTFTIPNENVTKVDYVIAGSGLTSDIEIMINDVKITNVSRSFTQNLEDKITNQINTSDYGSIIKMNIANVFNVDLLDIVASKTITAPQTLSVVSDGNGDYVLKWDLAATNVASNIVLKLFLDELFQKGLITTGDTVEFSYNTYRTGNATVFGGNFQVNANGSQVINDTLNYSNYVSKTKLSKTFTVPENVNYAQHIIFAQSATACVMYFSDFSIINLTKGFRIQFNNVLENIDVKPTINILEVSKDYTSSTDGWGVSKFNNLIDAHNYTNNKSNENNQYIIKVYPGTYNEWETVWIGVDGETGGSYYGIRVNDYVYFESTDIEHPENYILTWNGKAGFTGTMTTDQAMRRCLFHVDKHPVRTHVKGFTLQAKNCRYCFHPETAGVGHGNEWLLENCIIDWLGCPDVSGYLGNGIGIGISAGEKGTIRNCKFKNLGTGGIGGHNNGWVDGYNDPKPFVVEGSKLTIENCDLNGNSIGQSTLRNNTDTFDVLNIDNCRNVTSVGLTLPYETQIHNWKVNIINSDVDTTSGF